MLLIEATSSGYQRGSERCSSTGGRLTPAEAQNAPRSAGCVAKLWSPSGSVIQGCLLRVHRCTVGRNHEVSSSVPARTVRTAAPGLGVPLIHEPHSGQSQRVRRDPLSVVRSTSRGSDAVRRGAIGRLPARRRRARSVAAGPIAAKRSWRPLLQDDRSAWALRLNRARRSGIAVGCQFR